MSPLPACVVTLDALRAFVPDQPLSLRPLSLVEAALAFVREVMLLCEEEQADSLCVPVRDHMLRMSGSYLHLATGERSSMGIQSPPPAWVAAGRHLQEHPQGTRALAWLSEEGTVQPSMLLQLDRQHWRKWAQRCVGMEMWAAFEAQMLAGALNHTAPPASLPRTRI